MTREDYIKYPAVSASRIKRFYTGDISYAKASLNYGKDFHYSLLECEYETMGTPVRNTYDAIHQVELLGELFDKSEKERIVVSELTIGDKTVLAKGLDSGTAFEILSIDIADIDVGENIGANLQTAQAEADTKRFQAQAEQRRALAVAQEAEYQAEAQKNRALVVLAEADVPKAVAESLKTGKLGLMDYYRMQNVMADTQMRTAIGGGPQQS